MAPNATTLYWKLEDVPVGDGEAPHPKDIGHAWIYRPDGSEEAVRDGEWITRADAHRRELAGRPSSAAQAPRGRVLNEPAVGDARPSAYRSRGVGPP